MLFAFVAAAVFFFSASTWMWRLLSVAIALAFALVVLWVIMRLHLSPRMSRYITAAEEMWTRYPETVVVLQRLAENEVPATFPPARLGGGAEDDGADVAEPARAVIAAESENPRTPQS